MMKEIVIYYDTDIVERLTEALKQGRVKVKVFMPVMLPDNIAKDLLQWALNRAEENIGKSWYVYRLATYRHPMGVIIGA